MTRFHPLHGYYDEEPEPVDGGYRRYGEECGLCGVIGSEAGMDQLHLGIHSLQHRGQEAAGVMALVDGSCRLHKGAGLIDEVFTDLPGEWWEKKIPRSIAHVRYSTAGGVEAVNAQPLMVDMAGLTVGIAHNGTLTNAAALRRELKHEGAIFQTPSDTEIILHLIARSLIRTHQGNFLDALEEALNRVEGAYALLIMTDHLLIAVRDPRGFRPLCIGQCEDGSAMVASETIGLSVNGASYTREVEPGEMVWWEDNGTMQRKIFSSAPRKGLCIFEHVYFARPGSYVFGDSVYKVRKELGRRLAREAPVDADVIVPVPDSGLYAGLGYAEESGLPFDLGLSRNHYVGRTFIDPGKSSRARLVQRKLQPIAEALRDRRVCLIEDSIVRGNTSRARIRTLREVGVKEIHMRVSCPPHKYGCYFGIDFPHREELLANRIAEDQLCEELGLDSLGYLSRDGMLNCVEAHRPEEYCCACFDGRYPLTPRDKNPRNQGW